MNSTNNSTESYFSKEHWYALFGSTPLLNAISSHTICFIRRICQYTKLLHIRQREAKNDTALLLPESLLNKQLVHMLNGVDIFHPEHLRNIEHIE